MNSQNKILSFINDEDITTAFTLEITDVFEVSPTETYFEITQKPLL